MTAKRHRGKVDTAWRRRQRENHVRRRGLLCEGMPELDRPPHRVRHMKELQVHHIIPIHDGGDEYGPISIVCGPCNYAHKKMSYKGKAPMKVPKNPPHIGSATDNPLKDLLG